MRGAPCQGLGGACDRALSAGRTSAPAPARAADDTLNRITRTRQDADTVDDAAAEQAWRQIARLNSRVRLISHRSLGFHSDAPLIALIYLCCGGANTTSRCDDGHLHHRSKRPKRHDVDVDEEQVALEAVTKYLGARGQTVTVIRRPDREVRTQRAVDFEVRSNGRTVGVEVTSVSAFMTTLLGVERLMDAIEDALRPFVESRRLGTLVLRVHCPHPLKKRESAKLIEEIVTELTGVLLTETSDFIELADPPPPIEKVSITRIGRERDVLGHISTPVAWFVDSKVNEFIEWLIQKKADQGEGYEAMWIIIFARTPIHAADDLASGFERYRAKLPSNWQRIFYIFGDVTEVFSAWR